MRRHNYSIKFRTGRGESQGKDGKKSAVIFVYCRLLTADCRLLNSSLDILYIELHRGFATELIHLNGVGNINHSA